MPLSIAEIPALNGLLALCPMPGRGGNYPDDLAALLAWRPSLVLTMTSKLELAAKGAATLPDDLAAAGVAWRHLPIPDFGTPRAETLALWPETASTVHNLLSQGEKVLAHCMGGCGRSGMAILRLLVEAGENPQTALIRLRDVRPCAVETKAQLRWASAL